MDGGTEFDQYIGGDGYDSATIGLEEFGLDGNVDPLVIPLDDVEEFIRV
jgi:hypothetical protein